MKFYHFSLFILGYASSSAGSSAGAGLYNQNSGTYSKYPYSNQYTGYQNNYVGTGAGVGGFPYYAPYAPLPNFPSPFDFNNAFQQYYGSLNANFAK